MKRIVSVSIGSSSRNHKVEAGILGEDYIIERIGTDGDIRKAIDLIRELDGKVDAFGMGGIDLYLSGAGKRFMIKEAIPIMNAAKISPILDGTGLKNTLEREVIKYLQENGIINFKGKKVLLTCAIDRFKMAEAFVEYGSDMLLGDLIFALGIPCPIRSLKVFRRVADTLLPIVSLLPYKMLYPVGEKQNETQSGKYSKYYEDADIIAGDFHYIKRYMPGNLEGKSIITNTITADDVDLLRQAGVELLITTTPEFEGRSFGTNVMEALLVSVSGKAPGDLSEEDYTIMLKKLNFIPRVEYLNPPCRNENIV